MRPCNWVEEDREEIVSTIVDGILANMTFEKMREVVWDKLYEELIWNEWADLWMHAEEYAPELLDKFE